MDVLGYWIYAKAVHNDNLKVQSNDAKQISEYLSGNRLKQ